MSTKRDYNLLLNSTLTHIMRRIRRIDEDQGVGRARLSALAVLHFGGPCTMSELAIAEMVSRPTMHHIVNGLEAEGLVQRAADSRDGRRQVLTLTKEGTKVIVGAHTARIDYLCELTKNVSKQDLLTTVTTLTKIRDTAALHSEFDRP